MATYYNAGVPNTTATDADLRSWLVALKECFEAIGLVHVPSTGEIDTTTIVRSTATGVDYGWQMWRFDDSLQATRPIFLRVVYGNSTISSGTLRVNVRMGQAHDGVGNLTGATTSTANNVINVPNVSDFRPLMGSGGDGYIAVCIGTGSAAVSVANFFSVERSRSASGAATGAFVCSVWFTATSTSSGSQVLTLGEDGSPALVTTSAATLQTNQTMVWSDTVGFSAVYPMLGAPQNPTMGFIVVHTNDFVDDSTIVAPRYGVNRTYRHLGARSLNKTYGSNMKAAMIWE
jgi:hypothetical protein